MDGQKLFTVDGQMFPQALTTLEACLVLHRSHLFFVCFYSVPITGCSFSCSCGGIGVILGGITKR